MAFRPLRGTRGISIGTRSAASRTATRIGRQRDSIGYVPKMNWPNLALTKAQQAPVQPSGWIPPCATVAQAVRFGPVHCALMKAQLMICGKIHATMATPRTVRTVSPGVAIRFLRTQA